MTQFRYICRKDNPLIIKASGYVGSGGLGNFDGKIYQEVEGELPEKWEPEAEDPIYADKDRFNDLTASQKKTALVVLEALGASKDAIQALE